tara:strand:- start:777 stop:992 length:216 start_codon:yes stop_codon:yes gene_type:complete
MLGVFSYISYMAIYYLILVIIDLVGTTLEYKKSLISAENPVEVKFKVDFNTDLAVASIIYLISYYSGVFHG